VAQDAESEKSKLLFVIGGKVIGWPAADTGMARTVMKESNLLR